MTLHFPALIFFSLVLFVVYIREKGDVAAAAAAVDSPKSDLFMSSDVV